MSAWPHASVHLDAGRDFRGGQRQVLELLAGLQRRGRQVLLCCPRGSPLALRAAAVGIAFRPLTLRSGVDFPSAMRLARLVRDGAFDLVHVHDARSHGIARVAQGISREPALAANLFVTRRSVGGTSGRLDRLKYAAPGTHYIAISNPVRESLLQLGVLPEEVAVVPSGIDLRQTAPPRTALDPWGLRRRGLWTVGSIGQLTREKNHRLMLEAFAAARTHVPEAHLLLVGDGPLRRTLERRAAALGIAGHVTFAGQLEDVAPAYTALSVFVLSSDMEGLCTSLLDAMAAGVPVVTTAAGGVLEIARHGDSALVVPTRDPAALAGAIVRLHRQPELAARLAAGGRRVAERHGVDRMVDGTLAAYARLGQLPHHVAPEPGIAPAVQPLGGTRA